MTARDCSVPIYSESSQLSHLFMLRDCGGELGSGGRGEVFTAINTLEKEGRKSMYVCILGGRGERDWHGKTCTCNQQL